jgi:hypothetical protein
VATASLTPPRHTPSFQACRTELADVLAALPAPRRALFLASLVSGGGAAAAGRAVGWWETVDAAVRDALPALLQPLDALSAPPAAGSEAEVALRTLLRLLEWYQEPPPAHTARVEKTLRETGALASVLRPAAQPQR